MLRVRRLVPLALMTVLAATACGGATAAAPAAHVLGTEITDAQLATTANIFKSLFGLQHASCGQTSGVNDTDEAACNRYSLGALIQFRLSEGYASQNGVSVDDAAVQKAISAFESQVGADTLTAQLQANGVSHDDFTQLVHQSLLENEVAKHLALEKADDAQLRTQYEQNLSQYTTLTVDHILVKTKAEAEHVYQQVTAPGATREDFLALAKKVSIDPTAKQNSGALPAAPASQYVQEFSDAAIALEPGQISKPVRTRFGWHVIRLVDKQVIPFEQAREQLVTQQEQAGAFTSWVQQQLQTGQIDVNPSFGRFDPGTLQVVRITSTDPSATQPAPASAAASPSG